MKAYRMDDEDTEIMPDEGYPVEVSDAVLDRPMQDYDEDERPTGAMTTIRTWLNAAAKPGYLAGGEW